MPISTHDEHSSFEDEGNQGEIGNKDNNQTSTEVVIYTTPHSSLNTAEEDSCPHFPSDSSAAGSSRTTTPHPSNSRTSTPDLSNSRSPNPGLSNNRQTTGSSKNPTPFRKSNQPNNTPTSSQNRPSSNNQATTSMRESIQRAKRTHCDQGMIAASKRCLTARFDLLSAVMNARNIRNDPMLDSEIPLDLLAMMKDPLNSI